MTAEEFFKEYVPEKEEFKIDFSNIIGLMEAYHKAKVEGISDEKAKSLDSYIKLKHTQEECIGFIDGFEKAIQLLKQKI
jgi:predicted HicB family RNase H-like nuclease